MGITIAVPTARAEELALPIADILQRIRGVVRSSDGFDPKRSNRRFTIGAPDAVLLEVVPPLLTRLAERAPGVDLHLRTTLPQSALADLDARHADLMLQPLDDVPPRFLATPLYEEEFAIAMRAGHPVAARLTLARYCAASHVLVSTTGDPHGRVDIELKKLGRSRRIAATVPNFLLALSLVAQSDLLAAVPSRTAADARRFGAVLHEPPSPLAPLGRSSIQLIVPHAAMTDAGVAWLARTVTESARLPPRRRR